MIEDVWRAGAELNVEVLDIGHDPHRHARAIRPVNRRMIYNRTVGFFFSSRRRHTRSLFDWSSDVCSSDLDSMGNGTTILPNEVQRMTAGTGILHSEYSSPTDETHLLQIWIMPEEEDLTPGYEQTLFPPEDKQGKLKLVASRA